MRSRAPDRIKAEQKVIEEATAAASRPRSEELRGAFPDTLGGAFALGWANEYMAFDPALPFGGYKQSGVGRECGARWYEHYTEQKSVMMQLEA